jgi:hypothetical protein
VLEGNVQEGAACLGQDFALVTHGAVDVDPPAAALCHPCGDLELAVDENGAPVTDEDPCGHGREAVPGGQQAAGLVQRGADEPPVDDSWPGLVPLAEGEGGFVALDAFFGRAGKVDPLRVVAASPTRRIVVRRYPVYRRPPRSKCAL